MDSAQIDNLLSDMVRCEPDDSMAQRWELAVYIASLEERIAALERNAVRNGKP